MSEKLNAKRVSLSLAAVGGIVSVVCAILLAIAPKFTINLFGAIFHSIDMSQITKPITFGRAVFGTVEVIVIALIAGWLFAVIYNKIKG